MYICLSNDLISDDCGALYSVLHVHQFLSTLTAVGSEHHRARACFEDVRLWRWCSNICLIMPSDASRLLFFWLDWLEPRLPCRTHHAKILLGCSVLYQFEHFLVDWSCRLTELILMGRHQHVKTFDNSSNIISNHISQSNFELPLPMVVGQWNLRGIPRKQIVAHE